MSKSCKSLDNLHFKSSSSLSILSSPKSAKIPASLQNKLVSIKSRINDLILQKQKVLKCIKQAQIRFRDSQKREEQLNNLAMSIEQRMLTLEERKEALNIRKQNLKHKGFISKDTQLFEYIKRLRCLLQEEREIEVLEGKLAREEDISFETGSSESTQPGFISKASIHKQFLRNSICKIEYKEENISKNSTLRRYQKDIISKLKDEFDFDVKKFELDMGIFERKQLAFDIYKQKVLRKHSALDNQKNEINSGYKFLDELYKKNDILVLELNRAKKLFGGKKSSGNIEMFKFHVQKKEEKVAILRESLIEKEKSVRSLVESVGELEELVKKKVELGSCKAELARMLRCIEKEVEDGEGNGESHGRSKRLKQYIEIALQKEKEIYMLEDNLKKK